MLKYSIIILSGLLLSSVDSIIAQTNKQANVWYFGDKAGLDFNSGIPVPLTDGAMDVDKGIGTGFGYNFIEGCASVADAETGRLLFYTDGMAVWDSTHFPMPNGNNTLAGHWSTTQSAVIVPHPGNADLYYIFTADAGTSFFPSFPNAGVFAYSVVDMSLNGGTGDLVTINKVLYDTVTESQAATLHSNGRDYWSVSRRYNSDQIYAYLIDSLGLDTIPVISSTGYPGITNTGELAAQMKIAPNGKRLVLPIHHISEENAVMICDFSTSTGVVSNCFEIPIPGIQFLYGVEFSPDSKKLYATSGTSAMNNNIYQLDIESCDSATIANSVTAVGRFSLSHKGLSFQLAPDGKIYIAIRGDDSLAVIHQPNLKGASCNFEQAGIYLGGPTCDYALPNLITAVFAVQEDTLAADFTYTTSGCAEDEVQFIDNSNFIGDTWYWYFGDGTTDSIATPSHFYTEEDSFEVRMIIQNSCLTDSISKSIYVKVCDTIDSTAVLDAIAPEVFIPTAFSPDEDGINDLFKISGKGIDALEVSIFNRWGQKIFDYEGSDIGFSWDGKLNGLPLTRAMYLCIMHADLKDGKTLDIKSNLLLIH